MTLLYFFFFACSGLFLAFCSERIPDMGTTWRGVRLNEKGVLAVLVFRPGGRVLELAPPQEGVSKFSCCVMLGSTGGSLEASDLRTHFIGSSGWFNL
uniref:Putative secreted protein n=1 Tax=Ixodes ricinus TaxID=34613 RepID=A0A6B0U4L7_IXORI